MTAPAPALRSSTPPLREGAARSHVGRVRTINEDRVLACPAAGLWAVADGMGGHSGGDLAAQAVVDRLRALAASARDVDLDNVLVALAQANADIRRRNDRAFTDAGTTVVAAVIREDEAGAAHAGIAWAGDSRAYRLRDGRLEPLTRDHSVVQDLVDAGLLTAAQAERHPHANVITRALGIDAGVECQTVTVHLAPGDRLLLCSDGLSRSIDPPPAWTGVNDLDADALMAAALERDGSDNISLILV